MAKMAKTSAMMHFHSKGKNINPIFLEIQRKIGAE
jgi:hypothetical protein